jgi:bifunctional DNase/RNase
MKNIIGAFGAELSDILIDDLRDGTFYAKLNIDNQQIDARPSDAIALAVRYCVQIFVASTVMDEAAFVPEEEDDDQTAPRPPKPTPSAAQRPPKMSRLEELHQQLKEAIEKESYERAAQLRDEIRKLESRD